jgi:hypothetical protein
MFHPVGDLPPSVYWRRRFVLLGSVLALLVLIVLTVKVVTSGGSGPAQAAGTSSSPTATPTSQPAPTTSAPGTSHAVSPTSTARSSSSPSGSVSSSTPPKPCTAAQVSRAAAVGQASYTVGQQPVLSLIVKNVSTTPCVQDLADPQIVLRVYNGESRVWGSHDCKVQPGTDDRTLMPGAAVRVSIVWSGLTSQPNDCSNRQQVGAGTYTLYGSLSGHEGTAAQFTIR